MILELLFGDVLEEKFYNPFVIALALIIFGVAFIWIENRNKRAEPKVNSISEITFSMAFGIGMFQLLAAAFPGTSRSGATILGGILLGISRSVAAEFTFFLAIPVRFAASRFGNWIYLPGRGVWDSPCGYGLRFFCFCCCDTFSHGLY